MVLLARGRRLFDLREHGLILRRADTKAQTTHSVEVVSELAGQDAFDLVLVPVRSEQLTGVLPVLREMSDGSPVVIFGNYPGRQDEPVDVLDGRAVLGFPALGGVLDGPVVRYVPSWPRSSVRRYVAPDDQHPTCYTSSNPRRPADADTRRGWGGNQRSDLPPPTPTGLDRVHHLRGSEKDNRYSYEDR